MFKWFFVIFGLTDCKYEGGVFMGSLEFPKNYPWAPPAIKMITDNGKYDVNAEICMNVASKMHNSEWNPMWRGTQIILGLISMFPSNESQVGKANFTDEEIKEIVLKSSTSIKNCKHFELFVQYEQYLFPSQLTQQINAVAPITEIEIHNDEGYLDSNCFLCL